MTSNHEWGVFPHAEWEGGIVLTGRGYVVRRLDDPQLPYCHIKPLATYAREAAAAHNAERRGKADIDTATRIPTSDDY